MTDNKRRRPTELTALKLLQSFKAALTEKRISFLRDRQEASSGMATIVDRLIGLFQDAHQRFEGHKKAEQSPTAGNERASLADFLSWHKVHKEGRNLWTQLMRAAISHIDPRAKGHSELLNYLTAATEFEDLLYGLEPFYRDHTLHSLWVYLIGVKLMDTRGELEHVAGNLNWYVFNDIQDNGYPEPLEEWARLVLDYLNKELQKKRDAVWCIMALCHDLGYSLAKLSDLNAKVQAVLKFYEVSDFRHVGYALDLEHQYLVTQCLELMAMDIRITPGNDFPPITDEATELQLINCIRSARNAWKTEQDKAGESSSLLTLLMNAAETSCGGIDQQEFKDLARKAYDNALTKCFRDDPSYWRLAKALEAKEHGILSAYLLYKTMGIFADTSVRPTEEGWGLEDDEAVDNIIRGDILFAIAQHEFAYAHIDQMSSLAEILILCDELEEFSRLGRQLQSRNYHDTTAETFIRVDLLPGETDGTDSPAEHAVDIEMTYDSRHQDVREFADFCWRKARRLSRLFSLGGDKSQYQINTLKTVFTYSEARIGNGTVPDREAVFTMSRDGTVTIKLNAFDPVAVECRDDDVYVPSGRPPDSSYEECPKLEKWLKDKLVGEST